MKRPLFYFSVLFLLASCHELVLDNFPPFEKTLVVNGFVSNDSMLVVHVSATADVNLNPISGIENARVVVYTAYGDTIHTVHEGEGWYVAIIVPDYGYTYHCEVSVPGYAVVHANTQMPQPPMLQQVVHKAIAGKDDEGTSYPSLSFTFENNTTETRYYEAHVRLFHGDDAWQASLVNINDPILLNEGLPLALFSNALINSNTYTMTINYYTGGSGSSGPNGELHTTLYPLVLELRAISHDYYQFARSAKLYETGRYPEFGLHANHVFPLYSNTSSGYGVFTAYAVVSSDTIYPSYPEQ